MKFVAFEKTLDANEVAELAGVSRKSVERWLKAETLKGKKIGRRWHVNPQDLKEFLGA